MPGLNRIIFAVLLVAQFYQVGCGPGTVECTDGFAIKDNVCTDLDECSGEGNGHSCDTNAICTNSEGSYSCQCNQGYHGDGQTCERNRAAGLVIWNATLIDGNGTPPVYESAIVIVDDRIVEVALTSTVFVYSDDQLLDVEEQVVLPGFINSHVHQAYNIDTLEAWAQAGVTTVREVGAPLFPPAEWTGIEDWDDWVANILSGALVENFQPPKFAVRDQEIARPESARVLMAGPCLTATGGYPNNSLSLQINLETVVENNIEISPTDDARRKTQVLIDAGADVIKICIENHWDTKDWGLLTTDQIASITEVAHESGLRVTAHVSADEQLTKCLDANPPVDSTAHIVTDVMSDENITSMVDQDVTIVPTLAVWEGPGHVCDTYGMCEAVVNLGRFIQAGGRVALGDDYGNSGIALGMAIRDMELMQQAGMTNMDIIVAATRDSAFDCGLADDLGTIETGKIADIIILEGDPLVDINALSDLSYVIKDGKIIK